MASGMLKRLSEQSVPPPPEAFDRELNTRLNDRLLVSQLVDFVFRALPYASFEFGRALVGLAVTTLTGRLPRDRRRRH
jgi:hypothetical protein